MEDVGAVMPHERLIVFLKQYAVAGIHERLTVRLYRMPPQHPRHLLGHIRVEAGMYHVRMIPTEGAIFKAGARQILALGDLAAALEVLPLLALENGKLTQIVDEGCRQKLPVGDASVFHALQHLQCMRELATREHQDIRGINNLGLKLKQSLHSNFAKDRLFIFPFERDHIDLRLQPRALLNGEGLLLELIDSFDFVDAPDVIEATRGEASDVPDVIQTALVELALDKLLNRAGQSPGHVL